MKTPQIPTLPGVTILGLDDPKELHDTIAEAVGERVTVAELDDEELGALIDYHNDQIQLANESCEYDEAKQRQLRVRQLHALMKK